MARDIKLDTVLIKVASRCNINCKYCYVYNLGDSGWTDMPSQIARSTVIAIAQRLSEVSRNHAFATVLHGGEPLLLGPRKLGDYVEILRKHLPPDFPIGLQTNGILLTREILDICSGNKVSISVSIDGPKKIHDIDRVGHDGNGTFDRVLDAIQLLNTHRDREFLFTGVLSVVNPSSVPCEVYDFLKSLTPPSIDFLYRDGNHSKLPAGKASASSTEYGRWFSALLKTYLADPEPVPIRFLDDLIKLVLGGTGSKDGSGLTEYAVLVYETDGMVAKNDTLKSSFDHADRFDVTWNAKTHSVEEVLTSTAFRRYYAEQQPSSNLCHTCVHLRVCGGGMSLHRWKEGSGYDNPSVYCADQKMLIGEVIDKLREIRRSLC